MPHSWNTKSGANQQEAERENCFAIWGFSVAAPQFQCNRVYNVSK
jgi:hypothetical protein